MKSLTSSKLEEGAFPVTQIPARVRIGQVKEMPGSEYALELLYEIVPASYDTDAWVLEPGTLLEVVSTPHEEES
jgi:hypothetical protein